MHLTDIQRDFLVAIRGVDPALLVDYVGGSATPALQAHIREHLDSDFFTGYIAGRVHTATIPGVDTAAVLLRRIGPSAGLGYLAQSGDLVAYVLNAYTGESTRYSTIILHQDGSATAREINFQLRPPFYGTKPATKIERLWATPILNIMLGTSWKYVRRATSATEIIRRG